MTVRTTKKSVTFTKPFTLGDIREVLPPGVYEVETDEVLLEGLSFLAYRRTLTLIHLPAKPGHGGPPRTLTITPKALEAALERDAGPSAISAERGASLYSKEQQEPRDSEADCRALERAEDEGMTQFVRDA